jgi:hypothetical protein
MDETSDTAIDAKQAPDTLVRSLREKRRRFQQLLGDQRSQLESLEHALEHQLEQLCAELQQAHADTSNTIGSADCELQRIKLADEAEHLARLSSELEKQQTELAVRVAAIDQSNAQLQQAQQTLVASQQQLAADHEQAVQLRQRLEEQLAAIDSERQELSTLRTETINQRRHIARELNHQRTTQRLEIAKERESLEHDRAQLQSETAHHAADASASGADVRKHEDAQRRFEMVLEDLRELKLRNAELEERLAAAPKGNAVRGDAPGTNLNWEAQKRKLLASLAEDDDDGDDEERAQERLSIEGTIRITDEVVARKDQEIRDLKRQLEEQSTTTDAAADTEAAAVALVLDHDELVQQERVKLVQLQAELQQKLRQAEIDISLERARMARERADLDERMQACEAERARFTGVPIAGKPTERRWWTRLGLKDQQE